MRAWVARRRASGSLLPEVEAVGEAGMPYELLVQEVTDQGQRRPTKVARLYLPGTRQHLAELRGVRLVWLKSLSLVLSGFEVIADARHPMQAAQSWLCRLVQPDNLVGYRMRPMFQYGVALARRQFMDQLGSSSEGRLQVSDVHDPCLGRHTMMGQFHNRFATNGMLLDCELDWLGEERFQLSGLQQHAATTETPARLLRQGWLLEFDIQTPQQIAYMRTLEPKPSMR